MRRGQGACAKKTGPVPERDAYPQFKAHRYVVIGQSKAPRASPLYLEVSSREITPLCKLCTKTSVVHEDTL